MREWEENGLVALHNIVLLLHYKPMTSLDDRHGIWWLGMHVLCRRELATLVSAIWFSPALSAVPAAILLAGGVADSRAFSMHAWRPVVIDR